METSTECTVEHRNVQQNHVKHGHKATRSLCTVKNILQKIYIYIYIPKLTKIDNGSFCRCMFQAKHSDGQTEGHIYHNHGSAWYEVAAEV